MKNGIELIAEERKEQIEKHGKSIDMDIETNSRHQLSDAASILATSIITTPRKRLRLMPSNWDDDTCLKMCKKSHKERLIIAGALIAAEIDRLHAIEYK